MEQKHVFLSALSVGLGLVFGSTLGRLTGGSGSRSASGCISAEEFEAGLMRLVVDGKQTKVTFDEFPYYLSDRKGNQRWHRCRRPNTHRRYRRGYQESSDFIYLDLFVIFFIY